MFILRGPPNVTAAEEVCCQTLHSYHAELPGKCVLDRP